MLEKYPVTSEETGNLYTVVIDEESFGYQARVYRGERKWYNISVYTSRFRNFEVGVWEYDFIQMARAVVKGYEKSQNEREYAKNKLNNNTKLFKEWDGKVNKHS